MTTIYTDPTNLPERRKNDFYPTEPTLVRKILMEVKPDWPASRILDPGAGKGVWGIEAKKIFPGSKIYGVDIAKYPKPKEYHKYAYGDFTKFKTSLRFDFIIGNPPYGPMVNGVSMAELFVRKSMSLLSEKGTLVFLLRSNFLCGVGRYEKLFQEFNLYKYYAVSRRPSFYGGKTNATDYGVFVWKKGLKSPFYIGGWILHNRP